MRLTAPAERLQSRGVSSAGLRGVRFQGGMLGESTAGHMRLFMRVEQSCAPAARSDHGQPAPAHGCTGSRSCPVAREAPNRAERAGHHDFGDGAPQAGRQVGAALHQNLLEAACPPDPPEKEGRTTTAWAMGRLRLAGRWGKLRSRTCSKLSAECTWASCSRGALSVPDSRPPARQRVDNVQRVGPLHSPADPKFGV